MIMVKSMNSRVEKYRYDTEEDTTPSRFEKNRDLYNNVDMSQLSRVKMSSNVRVLEPSPKTIDIEKIKKYIENTKEETIERRQLVVNDEPDKILSHPTQEKREYDINTVLEKAKQNRDIYYEDEKHKKLRDTQYDILSKIKMYEEEDIFLKEKPEFNTDEKTLIDLINTVTTHKKNEELLGELKGSEDTLVTSPIDEEVKDDYIEKAINISDIIKTAETIKSVDEKPDENSTMVKNLDKSFYTNSATFSKEDFEGFEELEKKVKKNNLFTKIIAVIITMLVLGTIYVVLKYVLNIF